MYCIIDHDDIKRLFRIADGHKVGLEASGLVAEPRSTASYALAWYRSISDSLSLNIAADPGFNQERNLAGRLELIWQLR